jgi:hypothetical protein
VYLEIEENETKNPLKVTKRRTLKKFIILDQKVIIEKWSKKTIIIEKIIMIKIIIVGKSR